MKFRGENSYRKSALVFMALIFCMQVATAQHWPAPPHHPGSHYPPPLPRPGIPGPPMPSPYYPARSPYQAPSHYPPAPNNYRPQQQRQNQPGWYPRPQTTAPPQRRVQGVSDGVQRDYPTVDPGSNQDGPRKRYKSRDNPAQEPSSTQAAPRQRYKNRDNPSPSRSRPVETATENALPEETRSTPRQPVHDFRDFLKPAPRNRTTGGLPRKSVGFPQGPSNSPPSTMPPGDDMPPGQTMEEAFPLNGP